VFPAGSTAARFCVPLLVATPQFVAFDLKLFPALFLFPFLLGSREVFLFSLFLQRDNFLQEGRVLGHQRGIHYLSSFDFLS